MNTQTTTPLTPVLGTYPFLVNALGGGEDVLVHRDVGHRKVATLHTLVIPTATTRGQ